MQRRSWKCVDEDAGRRGQAALLDNRPAEVSAAKLLKRSAFIMHDSHWLIATE